MKTKTAGLVCVLLTCAGAAPPAPKPLPAPDDETWTVLIRQGPGNGERFLKLTKVQEAYNAEGILGGLFMAPLMGAPERGPEITTLAECTDRMSGPQLAAVAEKYLRDHPEKWDQPIAILFVDALESVCPSFDSAMSGSAREGRGVK